MNEFILDRVTFDTINLKWKHWAQIQDVPLGPHGPNWASWTLGVDLNCSEHIKRLVQRS